MRQGVCFYLSVADYLVACGLWEGLLADNYLCYLFVVRKLGKRFGNKRFYFAFVFFFV